MKKTAQARLEEIGKIYAALDIVSTLAEKAENDKIVDDLIELAINRVTAIAKEFEEFGCDSTHDDIIDHTISTLRSIID